MINISEDRKIQMKNLRFHNLKTDGESEDVQCLITVQINTDNRDTSFEIVKDFVKMAVEKVNIRNFSQNSYPEDDITVDDIDPDEW